MKLLISTLVVLAPLMMASPTFAVDNTISKLCRADNAGNTYQRPGGFCDAVANNKTMAPSGDGSYGCPVGYYKVNGLCTLI